MGEKEQGLADDAAARGGSPIKMAGTDAADDPAGGGDFVKMGTAEREKLKGTTRLSDRESGDAEGSGPGGGPVDSIALNSSRSNITD